MKVELIPTNGALNVECTDSLTEGQYEFFRTHKKQVKAFERDFKTFISVYKDENGNITSKISIVKTSSCDAQDLIKEVCDTHTNFLDWLNACMKEENDAKKESESLEEVTHIPHSKEFLALIREGDDYRVEGTMYPMKALNIMKALAITGFLESICNDETDPE